MIFVMWFRFLSMLQLTRTFGPMLRIVITMFGEVLKFLIVYAIILSIFSSVAALMFGSLDEYKDFFEVLLIMFGTGMGNYDLDFSGLPMDEKVGQVFTIVCVMVNSIVLLNFIIAILADTYTKLSS